MSTFARERTIRFADCDPAGIVFFPQYFVMFNGLVESWFDDALGIPYRELIIDRRTGLPTVRIEAEFGAISRMGDTVALRLGVERVGGKSLTLRLSCNGGSGHVSGPPRMTMRQVLVTTSLATHAAVQIPPDVRAAIERFTTGDSR